MRGLARRQLALTAEISLLDDHISGLCAETNPALLDAELALPYETWLSSRQAA